LSAQNDPKITKIQSPQVHAQGGRLDGLQVLEFICGRQTRIALYSQLATLKRIFIPIVFSLALCQTGTKADDGGYSGTVLDNLAATYVVQMDDGRLLDAEWTSGYDDWPSGDRVILTTESGEGYMYNEDGRTQVDVFPYDPANIGD
jgi:hypothetical protein